MSVHRYCPDCNCNVLEGVDKHQAWCPTGEAEATAEAEELGTATEGSTARTETPASNQIPEQQANGI